MRAGWAAKAHGLVALLAGLVVGLPLLLRPLPATHDGLHHLFRLFQLDQALRSHVLYPRILADMGFGYGYPVLNYYSPLSYYVAWVATALGAGYIGGIRAAHVLALALGGLATFAWLKQSLPRSAALLAAVAYSAFPYRLADIYVRGALAESLAFVFPPLLLWLATLTVRRRQARYGPALALAAAGFVLTHNLTAFTFAPVLALWLLVEVGLPTRPHKSRAYVLLAVAALLGLALSAFYWLPAVTEVGYVLAGQVGGEADLVGQLQPLSQWISPFVVHRYFPDQGVAAQHPFGLLQVVLILTGTIAFVVRRDTIPHGRRLLWCAAVTTAACTLLLLPLSAPVWEHVSPLSYLQFPWRLQAVLTLSTAVLAGGNALWLRDRRTSGMAVAILAAALVATGLAGLSQEPARMPGHDEALRESDVSQQGLVEYDFQTALWLREHGGEWLLEYLPRWALSHRADFFLPTNPEAITPDSSAIDDIQVLSSGPLSLDLTVNMGTAGRLAWHRFYFPGWQVAVDGRPVETRPESELGLLAVDLSAGTHRVQLSYGLTGAATWGSLLAAVGLLAVVVWSFATRLRLPVALLAVAAIGLAPAAWRAHVYPTTQEPTPVEAALGDTVRLAGYYVRPEEQQLEVTLYWVALRSPTQDYRVFVHAVGPDGSLAAQHDGQPGLEFSPTTRWIAGEIMIDRHYLDLPSSPVTLYTGMYTLPDVSNLPVTQDGIEVPERRVELGRWSP